LHSSIQSAIGKIHFAVQSRPLLGKQTCAALSLNQDRQAQISFKVKSSKKATHREAQHKPALLLLLLLLFAAAPPALLLLLLLLLAAAPAARHNGRILASGVAQPAHAKGLKMW
jgi:hypothetical protein